MEVFNLFLNLIKAIKNAMQSAKIYVDAAIATEKEFEDLTNRMISGTQSYSLKSGDHTKCYRIGNLLFMRAWGTANGNLTTAMELPYLKVPASNARLLGGVCSISGTTYPLVSIGNWSGTKYLKQNITSNVSNGANIVFFAILEVGGVIRKLIDILSPSRKVVMV